jgi:hypothetical protein
MSCPRRFAAAARGNDGSTTGTLLAPSSHALIEPCPAPVIPVSGIEAVRPLAGGLVCVTLFQEIPSDSADALSIKYRVAARLLWPGTLIVPSLRKLSALLLESPMVAELPAFGVPHPIDRCLHRSATNAACDNLQSPAYRASGAAAASGAASPPENPVRLQVKTSARATCGGRQ